MTGPDALSHIEVRSVPEAPSKQVDLYSAQRFGRDAKAAGSSAEPGRVVVGHTGCDLDPLVVADWMAQDRPSSMRAPAGAGVPPPSTRAVPAQARQASSYVAFDSSYAPP